MFEIFTRFGMVAVHAAEMYCCFPYLHVYGYKRGFLIAYPVLEGIFYKHKKQ